MEQNDKDIGKMKEKKKELNKNSRKFCYSPYGSSSVKSFRKKKSRSKTSNSKTNPELQDAKVEGKKAKEKEKELQGQVELPLKLPVIALHDRPLFPRMMSPIIISGETQLHLLKEFLTNGISYFGFCLISNPKSSENVNFQEIVEDAPDKDEALFIMESTQNYTPTRKIETQEDKIQESLDLEEQTEQENSKKQNDSLLATSLYRVGVVGKVVQIAPVSERPNSVQIVVKCLKRFSVSKVLENAPIPVCQVKYWHNEFEIYDAQKNPISLKDQENNSDAFKEVDEEIKSYSVAIINTIRELVRLNPLFKEELSFLMGTRVLESPAMLSDFTATMTTARPHELQEVLETKDVKIRLEKALLLIQRELEISKTQVQITKRIEERIGKQQREFFLKEQLKEIKKELGLSKDDHEALIEKYTQAASKILFSKEAKEKFDEELEKLTILFPSTPEYNNTRTYLDLLMALPWGKNSEDNFELDHAKTQLDSEHYGLKDVKERILEFISVAKLRGKLSGSIILLVGPPGVGKTSIGKSIAKSLNREFFRFSVGGLRDEAEIKGHRRTYIGAMPGKIIQALKICKTSNPIIMLDEIDKLIQSSHGDPASSLLEVLDPEQNKEFLDHYLDLRYDLSNILFVCTANTTETIPSAMLDRMEVIEIPGYLFEEKKQIAKNYLIPKLLEQHGLNINN